MSRREKILEVAFDLSVEFGVENVSLSQIVRKIGIQKSSLYNHFSSKEQLMEGFIRT